MKRLVSVWFVLVFLGTAGCDTKTKFRTVEGHVYTQLDTVRGPVDPVSAAEVSNNLDQTTAKTDASGRFVIRVKRVAADEFVVLRVDAIGKTACHSLTGDTPEGYPIDIFLDGGRFGTQRCLP